MTSDDLKGSVVNIYIAPSTKQPMESRQEIKVVAGKGLEGDRYLEGTGYYSGNKEWDSSITLIQIEAFETFERDYGIALSPEVLRRNIVTKDISLNALVGQKFKIGQVILEGIKFWPPCSYIAKMIGKQEVLEGFAHSGGLGAEIVTSGIIRIGDPIIKSV